MMSKISKNLLMAAVVMICAFDSAMAQGPAPPPALNEAPLDGFSALLLATGAGFGAKQLRNRKRG